MDDNQERKDFSSTESDLQISADEETLLDQLGISGAARRFARCGVRPDR